MKKSFVITGLMWLIITSISWAQSSVVGIKGGLNLASLTTDGNDDKNLNLGVHAGVFDKIAVNESFAVQPELLYSAKGMRINYDESIIADGESKFSLKYIDLPIKLVFNLSEDFELQVGPYVSYLVAATVDTNTEILNFFDIDSEDELDRKNFNTVDYGLVAGIGFDFDPVVFGANYSLGLNQVAKNDKASEVILDNAKNSVLQLFVGIKF